MRVDHQTLRDLEMYATPSGAPGLLDFLDRTRTRGGREVLRRRLTQPLDSATAITAVQRALRFITTHRSAFERLPGDTTMVALQRYLDSRVATLTSLSGPGLVFESQWVRRRYPDLFREIAGGTRLAAAFLDQIGDLVREASDGPELIARLLTECRTLLDTPVLSKLRTDLPRFGRTPDIFLRDHAAREAGRAELHRLIELVHELDALVSMADMTVEASFILPSVEEGGEGVEFLGLTHPFLQAPTPNDVVLAGDARLLFLTGPNMAGKSTYLKAVGIAVLLGHAGMGVPANAGRLGRFDCLITAIRTEDDLREGVSYFQAEARRVREVARHVASGQPCFVIADELFRGTNVKDACDASLSVLAAFAATSASRFLVASHLTELAEDLRTVPGVAFQRFEATTTDHEPKFDYRLRDGVSDQRLGMMVLEQEGVLELLALLRSLSDGENRTAHGAWPSR